FIGLRAADQLNSAITKVLKTINESIEEPTKRHEYIGNQGTRDQAQCFARESRRMKIRGPSHDLFPGQHSQPITPTELRCPNTRHFEWTSSTLQTLEAPSCESLNVADLLFQFRRVHVLR